MQNSHTPNDKRDFRCSHCDGKILIPWDLPPTTGPCPHCSGIITSPAPVQAAPVQAAPVQAAPVQAAPVQAIPVPAESKAPESMGPPVIPPPHPIAETSRPQLVETAIPEPPPAPGTPAAITAAPAQASSLPTRKQPAEVPHASDPSHGNKRKHKLPPAKAKPHKSGLIPVMLVLLLLIIGSGVGVVLVSREMGNHIPPPSVAPIGMDPAVKEANYLRTGWQKEATQVLRNFLSASTSQEKLPHILHSEALTSRIEDFYGGVTIDDSDTPAEAFSIYELSAEDHARGLFMMVFDQPPQFDLKEFFRPLASLEVQYGIDEADLLLTTLARAGNFAMEPMRVHAFFKRTPQGLKLDWEIFAQTKYRTFQNFVELPETGQTGVFRVFVVEDVPDKGRLEAGTRTYRMADPANTTDTARVNVKVDSETGRTLSIINWRGTKESRPITRTATVELSWTGDVAAPELEISRFICWEFLGLGGKEDPSAISTK